MRLFRLLLPVIILISLSERIYAQPDCALNQAYICEDFDSYDNTMPIGPQSLVWSTWSGVEGGAEDAFVSTAQSASGGQSLALDGQAGGGPQDVLLLLGDQTTGRYHIQFKMYIPAGNGGYYNMQHFEAPGTEFASQMDFAPGGTFTFDAGGAAAATGSFPEDTWFVIDQVIDLDNDWATLSVDGRHVFAWPFSWQAFSQTGTNQLGGFDFYPADENYDYFIDDLFVEGLPACTLDPESIICDDMESYGGGDNPIGPTSSFWTTWSLADGGSEDGLSSSDYANSGSYSMKVQEGQSQDVILLLGNKQSGLATLQWMEYVPAGATAYYNIQEDEEPGLQWNMDVFFNDGGGAPGVGSFNQSLATFTYPEDAWFMVRQVVDLDEGGIALWIDGNYVNPDIDFTGLRLGSIDFFSIDATNRYYIDDVVYKDGVDCSAWDPITATGTATDAIAGNNDGTATVEAAGGLENYTYMWDSGQTTAAITDLAPGDYTCTVSPMASFGGCLEPVTVTVTVGELVGTSDLDILQSIRISPNPTAGNVLFDLQLTEVAEVHMDLQNISGQVLAVYNSQLTDSPRYELDMSGYANGIYFARFTVGSKVLVRKIVLDK